MNISIDSDISVTFPEKFSSKEIDLIINSSRTTPFQLGILLCQIRDSGPKRCFQCTIEFHPSSGNSMTRIVTGHRPGAYTLQLFYSAECCQNPPCVSTTYHWYEEAGDDPVLNVQEAVEQAFDRVEAFRNFSYGEENNSDNNEYSVQVILKDCLVERSRQNIRGGQVRPLDHGYDHEANLSLATKYLSENGKPAGFSLPPNSEQTARAEHPATIIEFNSVFAVSPNGVIPVLLPTLKTIIRALALERGASPTISCYHVEPKTPGNNTLLFPNSIYRGHIGGGFASSPLTDLLDNLEMASSADGWIDLAIALFDDVKREKVRHHKLFKAWSILEARAKIKISSSNQIINDETGAPIPWGRRGSSLTLEKDVGKTLTYLRDTVYLNRTFSDNRPFTLTKRVLLAYKIRNIVAHEGGADLSTRVGIDQQERDALIFYNQNPGLVGLGALDVENWARDLIEYEIRQNC